MTNSAQTVTSAETENRTSLDINEIQQILPHRYPFLLIDRIEHIVPGERVTAIKGVTFNEPHFQGHFPGYPLMPGVLIVEAMAQAGGLLLLREYPKGSKLILFTGIEGAKFRKPVVPGDQLRIEVEVLAVRSTAGRMHGQAYVGDKLACEATLSCAIVDRPSVNAAGPEK